MPEMPPIYMPDPDNLPDGLVLSPAVEAHYRGLPKMYKLNWDSFGNGGDLEMPEQRPVAKVRGSEKANIANYAEWVQLLDKTYEYLAAETGNIADIPEKTAALCDEGRGGLGSLIDDLHVMAQVNPQDIATIEALVAQKKLSLTAPDGSGEISENTFAMALVSTTTAMVEAQMFQMSKKFTELGGKVKPPPNTVPDPKRRKQQTFQVKEQGSDGERKPGPATPEATTSRPGANPTLNAGITTTDGEQPGAPPVWDWDAGSDTAAPPRTSVVAAAPSGGEPVSAAADRSDGSVSSSTPQTSLPAESTPAASAVPASSSGLAQGFSPAAFALPAAMRQSMANPANFNQQQPTEPVTGSGRSAGTATPVSRPAAAAATSASAASPSPDSPPTRGAQSSQTGQAAHAPATATGAGTPDTQHRPAGPSVAPASAATTDKEPVVYTFPDGRSQNVSPVVRQALDAAFGNATGTDARQAYERTPAKLPEGKEFGVAVDPNQLVTGDIATWEGRLALVVALGDTTAAQLEVIAQGELQPFAEQMADRQGDFGPFTGFVHPAGIDLDPSGGSPAIPIAHSGVDQMTVPA